jgi:DNA-binding response OmpR family regulator
LAHGQHPNPTGRRILIVEDEIIVAMDLEDTLTEEGWTVVACVPTVDEALDAIDDLHPEAAILDLNLQGQPSHSVAQKMRNQSIPFVIVSGHGDLQSTHPLLASAPLVSKPWNRKLLMSRLNEILQDQG